MVALHHQATVVMKTFLNGKYKGMLLLLSLNNGRALCVCICIFCIICIIFLVHFCWRHRRLMTSRTSFLFCTAVLFACMWQDLVVITLLHATVDAWSLWTSKNIVYNIFALLSVLSHFNPRCLLIHTTIVFILHSIVTGIAWNTKCFLKYTAGFLVFTVHI